MPEPTTQDCASDAIDPTLVELINSYTVAALNDDYSGSDQAATATLDRAMELMVEAAERGEIPEYFLLQVEAHDCEERGDWKGALSVYGKVLEFSEKSASPFGVWKAHDDLAELHFLLGDREAALREQQFATQAARGADSEVGLRMALRSEATLLLKLDMPAKAAIRVKEGLAVPDPESIDKLGSTCLRVLLAECEALHGRIDNSRAILHECRSYLESASQMQSAAGVHSTLCYWWCVEARCCELDNDSFGELNALRNALIIAQQIDQLSHVAGVYTKARLMRVLDRLARALWRISNFDDARRAREEIHLIQTLLKLPMKPRPSL